MTGSMDEFDIEEEYEEFQQFLHDMEDPLKEAKMLGEVYGREFREKELEYDARGGRHECTVPEIAALKLLVKVGHLRRFYELRAPDIIIERSRKGVSKVLEKMPIEAMDLFIEHWPAYWQEFRNDRARVIDLWQRYAKKLGVAKDLDPSLN